MDICVVKGIITPSETLSPPEPLVLIPNFKKSENNGHHQINWQSILRDATFHSLIKHTGFTPSLDEKIETDRLLWEKIQSARFLRKLGKIDDFEKVKTGVLVDTTREHGYLEFRQSDRSVYDCAQSRCKPIYDRLLAVWRIQKFDPDDIWIRVKIPRYPTSEDVYEFTPKQGLKQINPDRFQQSKINEPNKESLWHNPTEEIHVIEVEKLSENGKLPISRLDSEYFHRDDGMKNVFKKQSRILKPQYTVVSEARQSYLPYILGLQIDGLNRPQVKNPTWTQSGAYYQVEPITVLSQFRKNEKVYDGFIPSVGPTGRPPSAAVYQQTIPKPILFEHPFNAFVPPRLQNTGFYFTSTTPKNFKPSTEFVRYSEPDPFYLDGSYAFTTPRSNDLSDIKLQGNNETKQLPTSINSQLMLYDEKINDSKETSEETTEHSTPNATSTTEIQPTVSKTSINTLEVTENEGQISLPTNSITKIRPTASLTVSQTANRLQIKTPQRTTTTVRSETFGYAPLFIKWGEKIRPTTNKSANANSVQKKRYNYEPTRKMEISTTQTPQNLKNGTKIIQPLTNVTSTDKDKTTLQPDSENTTVRTESVKLITETTTYFPEYKREPVTNEIINETTTQSEINTENEFTTITEQFNETTDINLDNWHQQTTNTVDPNLYSKSDTTTFIIDSGTRNLVIDIEDKSPEEVVNELTTIGVKNATLVKGYSISNEHELANINLLSGINGPTTVKTTTIPDQETDYTDPISVVVNRISKSYSYKTAKGQIRNIKQSGKDN